MIIIYLCGIFVSLSFIGYDGGMKRGHDDDYEDHGQKRRRGGGEGPRVELRFLLASKVRFRGLFLLDTCFHGDENDGCFHLSVSVHVSFVQISVSSILGYFLDL